MIEIKNEKIAPLPENMVQRNKELYRLSDSLTKQSGCSSVSVDVHFFDGDDRRIRSILVKGKDQEGSDICYFKNYYRNGQLSEGGLIKDGKYQEPHLSFNEDGTPQPAPLPPAVKARSQNGM